MLDETNYKIKPSKIDTEKLKLQLIDIFLYGSPTTGNKEKEVEIGGNMCHLCGADMLHSGISRTMVKKHRNVESLQVYTCGTSIYGEWKEYDDGSVKDKERHIHAGCISVE